LFSRSLRSLPKLRFLILSWSMPMIFIQALPPPLPMPPYMMKASVARGGKSHFCSLTHVEEANASFLVLEKVFLLEKLDRAPFGSSPADLPLPRVLRRRAGDR